MRIDKLAVIANPASRHNGLRIARRLEKELGPRFPTILDLRETQRPGHASEYAYDDCLGAKRPLIISVSGDGGYHEVIRGVLKAQTESGNSPIVVVYPAGNANDHYRSMLNLSRKDFIQCVMDGFTTKRDLLRFTLTRDHEAEVIDTHSYGGFVFTGEGVHQMSLRHYGLVGEYVRFPLHTLKRHVPAHIKIDGTEQLVSSISFHIIDRMAKRLKFPTAVADDGLMERHIIPAGRKSAIVRTALAGATRGIKNLTSLNQFSFQLLDDTWAQFDGELKEVSAGTYVHVECVKHALETLVYRPKAPEKTRGLVYFYLEACDREALVLAS